MSAGCTVFIAVNFCLPQNLSERSGFLRRDAVSLDE